MAHGTSGKFVSSVGWRRGLSALALAAMGACGGGGGGGSPPGSGGMTATIDGQAFASDAQLATATSR